MDVDTLFDVLFFHSFLLGGKRPSISEVLSLSFLSFFLICKNTISVYYNM